MCILFLSAFSFIHYGKENENAEIGYVSAIAAIAWKEFLKNLVLATLLLTAVF